jgi:hypothetical protein
MNRAVFGKVITALTLFAVSAIANAVQVTLLVHNQTSSSGTISTLITDGSHVQGQPASTAVFDWDGTTLSSTGLYSAVSSIGSSAFAATILNDQITDLNIDTSTTSAGGSTAYNCVEGTFLSTVGASGCGGHNLGSNFTNDTTTTWGPGLATSQTLGGDDVLTGGGARMVSSYDFGVVTLISGASTTTPGAVFTIGNTIGLGTPSGEVMQFQVDEGGPVATFNDVPTDYWAWAFIETLAASGITAGCGNDNYCPQSPVTRAQMAVFLERGIHGSNYSPPAATGNTFLDVAATDFAASFIEQFYLDGITGGCGNNNYCPNVAVTRDQMAVFLLRAKHGSSYMPPAAIGRFDDVPLSHWAVHWIEQLAEEGITSGCDSNNYCPDTVVTRDQMAVFLVRTFGL